jgi:hypothetical protein
MSNLDEVDLESIVNLWFGITNPEQQKDDALVLIVSSTRLEKMLDIE